MKPHSIIGLVVSLLIWIYLASSVLAESVVLALSCVMLAVLGLRPIAVWCHGKMESLPIMEAHALVCIPAFLLPILVGSPLLEKYDVGVQIRAIAVICVYLFCLQATAGLLRATKNRDYRIRGGVLDRLVGDSHDRSFLFVALGFWWLITVARPMLLLGWLGSAINIVQALATGAGGISVLVLFLKMGRGELKRGASATVLVFVGSGVLLGFTGGFLIGGCVTLVTALLGYTMGSRRLPIVPIVTFLVLVSVLHAGKAEMRARYWVWGTNWNKHRVNAVEVYSFWVSAGLDNLLSPSSESHTTTNLLTRVSLAHMVLLAVSQAPDEVPFLQGRTYLQSAQLVVPRVLWPDKPRGSLPTETLAIHFGVQTTEGVTHTAVGMGLIAEAWGNFGWVGVVLIGGLMGMLFAAASQIVVGRTVNQVGFLVGALFLAEAISLESTLGPLLVQVSHKLFVIFPILMFLSRPVHSNRIFAQTGSRRISYNREAEQFPRPVKSCE